MPLIRNEQEEQGKFHAAEEEGEERESHDAEQDQEQEEDLDATQSIQDYIDHCVGKIERRRLYPAPDGSPSAVYPQFKGKGRVDAIESPSSDSESESDYDAKVDTDTDAPVQHYSVSRALIRSPERQHGFNMGLRGEGPSRLMDPSESVSAPPSPLKVPQAAESDQQVQAPATAPPMTTRVPQANRIATGLRFKQPSPALGPVYAELYGKVVSARKVREKVQQRRNVAETKVREGALGWSQGRLDLIIAEWDVAQEAVVAAELALDAHRRAL